MTTGQGKLQLLCHDLYKRDKITFNEWVVIAQAVEDWKPHECLPPAYTAARRDLLRTTD